MRRKAKPAIYDELNVTPLMDLAWTLLIVFIIIATATVQGITVNLPKASPAPNLGTSETKAITITSHGEIYLNTTLVTLTELESQLKSLKATDPNLPVIVKGDASVRYDQVIQVLDIVKRVNITSLGLVTSRVVK
jgi:biopolymer transport protein ExbD